MNPHFSIRDHATADETESRASTLAGSSSGQTELSGAGERQQHLERGEEELPSQSGLNLVIIDIEELPR